VILGLLFYAFSAVLLVLMASGIYCGWIKREKLGIAFFLAAMALEVVIVFIAHFGGSW
jgi:hypothetical protein